MSNTSINIPNSNKYILSSLDIQYIGYFYSVFPLHLNSFYFLFSNVIDPKLSNVKNLISIVIDFCNKFYPIDLSFYSKSSYSINYIPHLPNQTSLTKDRILLIGIYINQLELIYSNLDIYNIHVKMKNVALIVKEIKMLLNEIYFIVDMMMNKILKLKATYLLSKIHTHTRIYPHLGFQIINKLKKIKSIFESFGNYKNQLETKLKEVESSVSELECAIEGVTRNLIRCSLKSSIDNVTVIEDNLVKSQVYGMYSVSGVMDYNSLVNRMLEFWTFSDQSVELFKYIRFCLCALSFETKHRDHRPSTFPYPLHSIRTSDINPVSEFVRQTMADNVGNHMCLCLVIKYHLRTSLLKCILFLRNEELGTLDTLSRKFDNYNSWAGVQRDLWKMCGFVLNFIYELTSLLRNRYLIKVKNVCMCSFYDEKNYNNFVSIILVISSLIENIWTMDHETVRLSIQKLSILMWEFDMIDSINNKSTDNNYYTKFIETIKMLFCPLEFCILSSKLNLISVFVTSSEQVPYEDWLVKPYVSNISLYDIFNFHEILKQLKQYDHTKGYIEWVLEKYESYNTSNNLCNQFKNQCCVLSSNIVIIMSTLISVKIKSKLYPGKCDEIKKRLCEFLKIVCKCKCSECCIKQLISSTGKICNGGNTNNCEELFKKCIDSCCVQQCCNDRCPCSKLKDCCDKLKVLCCQSNAQNGICQILEKIKQCKGQKEGDVSCKSCVCCKIVVESILIFQNMFKSNIWIISKNIIVSCKYLLEILDKIKKTQNSTIIIKKIVDNYMIYSKLGISLVKNNLITSSGHGTGLDNRTTDATSVRNWGYDTHYERQVTTPINTNIIPLFSIIFIGILAIFTSIGTN